MTILETILEEASYLESAENLTINEQTKISELNLSETEMSDFILDIEEAIEEDIRKKIIVSNQKIYYKTNESINDPAATLGDISKFVLSSLK